MGKRFFAPTDQFERFYGIELTRFARRGPSWHFGRANGFSLRPEGILTRFCGLFLWPVFVARLFGIDMDELS